MKKEDDRITITAIADKFRKKQAKAKSLLALEERRNIHETQSERTKTAAGAQGTALAQS